MPEPAHVPLQRRHAQTICSFKLMTIMKPDERTMARLKAGCICKGVKLIRLIEAIDNGATTVAEVQRACGIGDGSCLGKRCGSTIGELLRQRADIVFDHQE